MEAFSTRLRNVFDQYVTHRRNTGISVPEFPDGCSTTASTAEELSEVILAIADEETYLAWLMANLDACCDDRFDDIGDLIDFHAPTYEDMKEEKDGLLAILYGFKNEGESEEEYYAAQLEDTQL
jgi:hypothetical protein